MCIRDRCGGRGVHGRAEATPREPDAPHAVAQAKVTETNAPEGEPPARLPTCLIATLRQASEFLDSGTLPLDLIRGRRASARRPLIVRDRRLVAPLGDGRQVL